MPGVHLHLFFSEFLFHYSFFPFSLFFVYILNCLANVDLQECIIYKDDKIFFSAIFQFVIVLLNCLWYFMMIEVLMAMWSNKLMVLFVISSFVYMLKTFYMLQSWKCSFISSSFLMI